MLNVPLEKKYTIPFVITSVLYNIFDYGVHNFTLLITILNIIRQNNNKPYNTKMNKIQTTFKAFRDFLIKHQHIYLLFHLILPIIIQLIHKKYVQFIRNKISQKYNTLFIESEIHCLINNEMNGMYKLYQLHNICQEQLDLYTSTSSQFAKFCIAAIIIATKNKIYAIALPLGYFIILKILNYIYTKNDPLNLTNQKRITNYLLFGFFFIMFPLLLLHTDHYDIIGIGFYCFVITTMDFQSLNTLNINNHNIDDILQLTPQNNSNKISNAYALYPNTDNVSIRDFFHLYNLEITDHQIIEILDALNLIPELYKINPHILEITMNNSQISTNLNTRIGIARILASTDTNETNIIYKHIDPDSLITYRHLIGHYNFVKA